MMSLPFVPCVPSTVASLGVVHGGAGSSSAVAAGTLKAIAVTNVAATDANLIVVVLIAPLPLGLPTAAGSRQVDVPSAAWQRQDPDAADRRGEVLQRPHRWAAAEHEYGDVVDRSGRMADGCQFDAAGDALGGAARRRGSQRCQALEAEQLTVLVSGLDDTVGVEDQRVAWGEVHDHIRCTHTSEHPDESPVWMLEQGRRAVIP